MQKIGQRLLTVLLALSLLFSTVPVALAADATANALAVGASDNTWVWHDLSDGPLIIDNPATATDYYVTGSYIGDESAPGIKVNGEYNGTITLDNVSITTRITEEFEIDQAIKLTSGLITLNLIGESRLSGDVFSVSANNSILTIDGSGSLTAQGGISANVLTINAPLTVSSVSDTFLNSGVGISGHRLVVNADLKITSGRQGIEIYNSDDDLKAASPIEINADVTISAGDTGICAAKGIHLNNGNLSITVSPDEYSEGAHGIAWGDGSVNRQAAGTTVTSTPGMNKNGETGLPFSAFRWAPASMGGGNSPINNYFYAERSSFTDTSTGGFPDFSIGAGVVYDSDPLEPPMSLAAIIPPEAVPSWLQIGDYIFRGDPLDSETTDAFVGHIRKVSDKLIHNFIGDISDLKGNALWMDLYFVDQSGFKRNLGFTQEVTIYLPYPAGRNADNNDFLLVPRSGSQALDFQTTPYGIKFKTKSFHFSFALIYKDKNTANESVPDDSGSDIGGSGRASAPAAQPANTPIDVAATAAISEARDAVEKAKEAGDATAVAKIKNPGSISLDTLQAMAKGAEMPLKLHADSITRDGRAVDVRITFAPAQSTKGLNLSASTLNDDAQRTIRIFDRYFSNNIMAVSFGQQGRFGQTVEIAAKLAPTLNTANLVFYLYDKASNSYNLLKSPKYSVDQNGYVHFTTEFAGSILVSDGPIKKI